jgi:hypothetical protein
MQIVRARNSGQPAGSTWERLIAAGGYAMLLVLGALEGLIGSFQYSRALGSVPVAAVAFAVLIGVTCVLGAFGTRRPLGGLMPGVGWLVTTIFLSRATQGGSVLITNTAAGEWFLFGGAVCAAVGVVTGFIRFSPKRLASADQRGSLRPGQPPAGPGSSASGASSPGHPELGAPSADARNPDR